MKNSGKPDEAAYLKLKTEIEETFGRKIHVARDCILLSEDIYAKVSARVNSNTLRRLFGLVKSEYLPSATTVEILSKYCGFASFDEFLQLKSNYSHVSKGDYYSQSILNYLFSIFRYSSVREYQDKTFISIVENTIHFLQRHTELIDKFQRAISKTSNGQEFYYEQFINIDKLNSFYGDGLRYYLTEKNTIEAQILGHSLLCIKYWLSEKPEEVKKHHDEVMRYHLTKSMHPSLCGRFFTTQLLYADIHGLPVEKIIIKAQQTHAAIRPKTEDQKLFPHFEYIVSPVLLLTGHHEEALYYLNFGNSNYPRRRPGKEKGFYQTLDLVTALALLKTGKLKEARALYEQIHPSRFYFLTKKTNMIMYLFLGQQLKMNNASTEHQLKSLVKETGFTRLCKI